MCFKKNYILLDLERRSGVVYGLYLWENTQRVRWRQAPQQDEQKKVKNKSTNRLNIGKNKKAKIYFRVISL